MSLFDKVKEEVGFGKEFDPVGSLIYSLKTDSELPTLVVEGPHDEAIYRWIERCLNEDESERLNKKINIQPVGNRDNVIEIYKRKQEFESRVPVAFMADLDMWVFDTRDSGGPNLYPDIIWTSGYSLENDLYSDGNPENNIIDAKYQKKHQEALKEVIVEFANTVALWRASGKEPSGEEIEKCYNKIKKDYKLKLRGKTLFKVLDKFCSARNHLELCKDVFDTIELDKGKPPLLSKLILNIQQKIKESKSYKRRVS